MVLKKAMVLINSLREVSEVFLADSAKASGKVGEYWQSDIDTSDLSDESKKSTSINLQNSEAVSPTEKGQIEQ